jgi:hypothetical protein
METAELLSRLKPSSNYKQLAEALREDSNIQTIVDLIRPQEAWEMCLNALANLHSRPQTPGKPESELRLAWFITFYPSRCVLQPREQKVNAKGEWSKGRPNTVRIIILHLTCSFGKGKRFEFPFYSFPLTEPY